MLCTLSEFDMGFKGVKGSGFKPFKERSVILGQVPNAFDTPQTLH